MPPLRGEASSFRDPGGFVYHRDGVIYRQINQGDGETAFQSLIQSGLYETLVSERLLIPHEVASLGERFSESASVVIRPEPVPFISYPYEWCFGQLKDAALLTLRLQREALAKNLSLKDASAYNVQWAQGTAPVFIDTLSFEPYREGTPWVAYQQFCQHFLAPLALMAHVDTRLNSLLLSHQDGIPLDIAAKLLPVKDRLSFPLLIHIFRHSAEQRRHADTEGREQSQSAPAAPALSKHNQLGLLDNLEGAVQSLNWNPGGTEWADYYENTNYERDAMEAKERLVADFLSAITPTPARVSDLGANNGRFSRIASRRGIWTLALDIDPAAVEKNHRDVRASGEENLLPLVQNLADPSPGVGWAGEERPSFETRWTSGAQSSGDAALALALIHHIAIGNNVPLARVAEFMARLSAHLIIEWVPKEDGQVKRLLSRRADIFTDYHQAGFETTFGVYFDIMQREAVPGTVRTLYRMRRKELP